MAICNESPFHVGAKCLISCFATVEKRDVIHDAERPFRHHASLNNIVRYHTADSVNVFLFVTGMLTITDFIKILQKYYKSPNVSPYKTFYLLSYVHTSFQKE